MSYAGAAQTLNGVSTQTGPEESLTAFVRRVENMTDSAQRSDAIQAFVNGIARRRSPVIGDSTVSFVYSGRASRVNVAGDFNGWNPFLHQMERLPGTDFFHFTLKVPRKARFEYKLIVDSLWMLDPFNDRRALGGYGENSEVRMPGYVDPPETRLRPDVAHGNIDTILYHSKVLGHLQHVYVYRPPGDAAPKHAFPTLFVADGGEYLSLARMNVILDNLIADRAIRPVICVFLDPRTNPADSRTSMRLKEYALSDTFVNALSSELIPFLRGRYPLSANPRDNAVMGASLGGLFAAYAALTRSDLFGGYAAQSPAFWWENSRLIDEFDRRPRRDIDVYLDTGTLHDAAAETRRMRDVMKYRGYRVHYEEHPEGHNWVNWQARIGTILRHFWGTSLTIDRLGITVKGGSREFVYTDKRSAFLFGETNGTNRTTWQGLHVESHKYLDDYILSVDGRELDRRAAIATVYPGYLRRVYPDGIMEELHPLDELSAFAIILTSPHPTEAIMVPHFADARRDSTLSIALSSETASVARLRHLHRTLKEDFPVWLTVHAPGCTPTGQGGRQFQRPIAFASTRARTHVVIVAVGDERDQTEAAARRIAQTLPTLIEQRHERMERLLSAAGVRTGDDRFDKALAWANLSLDALVMRRGSTGIYAGLPWFDNYWGRDTFIALPGAALVTGRYELARDILQSFADLQNRDSLSTNFGRIPNYVSATDTAYNTADGTPRFVMMVREYLRRSGNDRFGLEMYPIVLRSIEGTLRYHTDSLGFLCHGDAETWMDAVGPDGPWSPRGNRANDIQALWAAQLETGIELATQFADVISARSWNDALVRLKRNFLTHFVSRGGIADRLLADGRADMRLRPNQIFTGPLLDDSTRTGMTLRVTSKLTYPYGVASLSQDDPGFHPYHQYQSRYPKDAAYHNGTVWTWLQGPLVSELCRINRPGTAYTLTDNAVHQILDRAAVGSQSELLDAIPHPREREPRLSGTVSQAWNLAEFVRNFYDDYLGIDYRHKARTLTLTPHLPPELRSARARVNTNGSEITVEIAGSGATQWITLSSEGITDSIFASIFLQVSDRERRAVQFRLPSTGKTQVRLQRGRPSVTQSDRPVAFTEQRLLAPLSAKVPPVVPFARPVLRAGLASIQPPPYPLLSHEQIVRRNIHARGVVDAEDPVFDDRGTGRYTYPLNDNFTPGSFDIRRLTVSIDTAYLYFVLSFRALSDPGWHPEYGFQLTFAAIAIDEDGLTGSGRLAIGRNANLELDSRHAYEKIVYVGGGVQLEDASGKILAVYLPDEEDARQPFGDVSSGTVRWAIPRALLGTPTPSWTFSVAAGAQDDHGGAGLGEFRTVNLEQGEWNGGGKEHRTDTNVYDMLIAHPRR
ncbi:MAG: amylo-alpha-1,6-glucosidase [Bacteroidota bacterium]